jgi:superfamily II DNA or RNA helicase
MSLELFGLNTTDDTVAGKVIVNNKVSPEGIDVPDVNIKTK